MKLKDVILKILEENKGRYVSGEEIAEKLSVSRNSVWKAINRLKSEGHIIYAVTNKGYYLAEKNKVFTANSVYELLNADLCERLNVNIVPTVGSTNTELKILAEKDGAEGEVLIALEQTAGRGRLGKSFFSPKDTGLYMSILLRPNCSANDSLYITACAAVSAAEAIEKTTGVEAGIKWVNDIYVNRKKVCGILTEASLDFVSCFPNYVVLGIGINLTTAKFPEEIVPLAGSVSCEDIDLRGPVAAEFLNSFFSYYANLKSLDFLPEYRKRSILTGQKIMFSRGNETFEGKVLEIDDRVRLVTELDNGEIVALSSGEVTLVRKHLLSYFF